MMIGYFKRQLSTTRLSICRTILCLCLLCSFLTATETENETGTGVKSPLRGELPKISFIDLLMEKDPIGCGSFGYVYKGTWRGQEVAIKVLHLRILSMKQIEEFENEASLMWRSQFSNIIKLLGVCTDPGHCSMVLELMPYGSLCSVLYERKEKLTEKKKWKIAIDIAEGLRDLHANGVIHRDLKSGNILLNAEKAKIGDFGLAKLRLMTLTSGTAVLPNSSVGTLRWRAPELFNVRPPKASSTQDMFSYGMVLWELASGKLPFEDQHDDQIIIAGIKNGEREEIPDDCPKIWREIIEACWDKDPLRRPSAPQVLKVLEDAYQDLEQSELRSSSTEEVLPVGHPLSDGIAEKYKYYEIFMNGRLIYKPNKDNDDGKIVMRIADLQNPLSGEFDLSRCGDAGKYLSINTGYKQRTKIPANKNKSEVWIVPRFTVERNITKAAAHINKVWDMWESDHGIGIFFTWYDDNIGSYYYGFWKDREELDGTKSMYLNYRNSQIECRESVPSNSRFDLQNIYIRFFIQFSETPIIQEPAAVVLPVGRPLPDGIEEKYRESYETFMNGRLIYKPNKDNDDGKIVMRIADLQNPLSGEFDLSRFGNEGMCSSINTGYKQRTNLPGHKNKMEVWIAPRFIVERDTQTTAKYFYEDWDRWTQEHEVGILFTWNRWPIYDYWFGFWKASDELDPSVSLYDVISLINPALVKILVTNDYDRKYDAKFNGWQMRSSLSFLQKIFIQF